MQNIQIVHISTEKRLIQRRQRRLWLPRDLTGKSTTTDPVEVTTDPNTKVEDKDGNVIGSGTTNTMSITPTKPIP